MKKTFFFITLLVAAGVVVYFTALRNGPVGERTDRFPLDEGQVISLREGNLAELTSGRFVLYDRAGRERASRAVDFETPALTAAGRKIIAYDRAGTGVIVADLSGVKAELDIPVLTAAGNGRGQYILVSTEDGYRDVALLYDAKDKLTYKWYSAERYIFAVTLSPTGGRMAVAAVGQQKQGESVSAVITFLEPGVEEPLGTAEIIGEIPLAAYSPDNNHVCILTESGVYFYSDEGVLLGHYPIGGGFQLLSFHTAEEALFLNIGRNEGGQHSRIVCLSYTGTELGSYQLTEGADAISAAGRWCAVLEAGTLTRLTLDGTELKTEPLGLSSARGLTVDTNGDILLLYSGYGKWDNRE